MTAQPKKFIKNVISSLGADALIGGSTKTAIGVLTNIVDSYVDIYAGSGVSVVDFGADSSGSSDSTAAFNAAVATGLNVVIPAGMYRITDAVNLTTNGQIIQGQGRGTTTVFVPTTFNQAALGVFVASGGAINGNAQGNGAGCGPDLRDFRITFDQTGVTTRGGLNPYPPALYFQNAFNFKLLRMRISQGRTGIDMRGDCGGAVIDDLEISCYDKHLWIDGSTDTVRLHNARIWPFDMTATQLGTTMFQNAATIGIFTGRCDAMNLSNCLFICGTQLQMFAGVGGAPSNISGSCCAFDSNNGIVISAGTLQLSSSYFTAVGSNSLTAISMSGGGALIEGAFFQQTIGGANSFIQQTAGILTLTGCRFDSANADVTMVQSGTAGVLNLTGCTFNKTPNTAYARPAVHVLTGLRCVISGNQLNDKGTGAGTFVTVDADDFHAVMGNVAIGYTMSVPTAGTGVYYPNLTGVGNYPVGNLALTYNAGGSTLGALSIASTATDTNQGAQIKLTNSGIGGAAATKWLRINSDGSFSILNGAYSAFLLTIQDGGGLQAAGSVAIPAGGTTGQGFTYTSTANFGVFFGSGVPTLSAAKGSLYLRSDGTTTNNRAYINTDGGATWTALTTAA